MDYFPDAIKFLLVIYAVYAICDTAKAKKQRKGILYSEKSAKANSKIDKIEVTSTPSYNLHKYYRITVIFDDRSRFVKTIEPTETRTISLVLRWQKYRLSDEDKDKAIVEAIKRHDEQALLNGSVPNTKPKEVENYKKSSYYDFVESSQMIEKENRK